MTYLWKSTYFSYICRTPGDKTGIKKFVGWIAGKKKKSFKKANKIKLTALGRMPIFSINNNSIVFNLLIIA